MWCPKVDSLLYTLLQSLHRWWIQNLTHVYQSWTIYLLDDYNEDGDHTVCSAGEMAVYIDSWKHSQTLCLEYILSIFYILYLYCRIMHLSLHKICPRKCDSHQSHMNTWVITCLWLFSKVEDDGRLGIRSHCYVYVFHISQVCPCPAYRDLCFGIISTFIPSLLSHLATCKALPGANCKAASFS